MITFKKQLVSKEAFLCVRTASRLAVDKQSASSGWIRLTRGEKPPLNDRRLFALAGRRVFTRGVAYHHCGAVLECLPVTAGVEALVVGGALYRVSLWSEAGCFYWQCDCPVGQQGSFCKHAVATGLVWWRPELIPLRRREDTFEDDLYWLTFREADRSVRFARIRTTLDDLMSREQYQTVTRLTARALGLMAETGWAKRAVEETAIQPCGELVSLLCYRQAAAHWQAGYSIKQAAAYVLEQQLAWAGAGGIACEAAITTAYEYAYGADWQTAYAQGVEIQAQKVTAGERGAQSLSAQRRTAWLRHPQTSRKNPTR